MSDSLIACQPRMEEPSNPRPSLKGVQFDAMDGNGEMLLHAGKVHEAEIDRFDFLFLDELEHVRRSFRRVHKSPHFF